MLTLIIAEVVHLTFGIFMFSNIVVIILEDLRPLSCEGKLALVAISTISFNGQVDHPINFYRSRCLVS